MMKDSIIVTYGKFEIPTKGHEKIIQKVSNLYRDAINTPDLINFTTKCMDESIWSTAFPDNLYNTNYCYAPGSNGSIFDILRKISDKGYRNLYFVCGEDRAFHWYSHFRAYHLLDYFFIKLKVISVDRPEGDISTTKMKEYFRLGDKESFRKGCPIAVADDPAALEQFWAYTGTIISKDDFEKNSVNACRS